MTNVFRSAKSGSSWTTSDLVAHNIYVHPEPENIVEFFGHGLDSIAHLDPNLFSTALESRTIPANFSPRTYRFLAHLIVALNPDSEESVIDTFGISIFEETGFDITRGTVLQKYVSLPLSICGIRKHAKPSICISNLETDILLVIQQDKTKQSPDLKARVIAEAIATFQYNNAKRAAIGIRSLDSMIIPCITMVGRQPCFYKVPVTEQLNNAVAARKYPEDQTVVTWCTPPVPGQPQEFEGMKAVDYRRAVLQYYVTFRGLAESCWTAFLI